MQAESFTQEMNGSKAVNPMMIDDEDSFSKGLEDIVLSARRVSSTNPYEGDSDPSFSRSDISNTKANLVGKFEAEAFGNIKFN